jgi:6-phosphogluconolactonase
MMIYVANADSHDISVLELNKQDGRSHIVETVAAPGSVMALAIRPDRRYLYAAISSEPYSLSSWAISQDSGRLTSLQTVPAADNMAYLSIDRTGRYLLGAAYFGDKIAINTISPTGEVSPNPLRVMPSGKHPHCIVIDPSNQFLFVSNLGDDVILQYRFNERNGEITPNQPPAVAARKGAGPRHIVFHPDRRWVFSTNELDGTVNTHRLSPSGTLTLLGSISVMPAATKQKPWAADIHLSPDGRFLYASERSSSTIAACRINEGTLTLLGHYPTETQPRGFTIDPEGKYLLAVGETSNGLSIYQIDGRTGALHQRSRIDVGRRPNWIEVLALSS